MQARNGGAVRTIPDRCFPLSRLKPFFADERLKGDVSQTTEEADDLVEPGPAPRLAVAPQKLLAIVGMWGVLSYAIRRRTHEIGIRLALGAAGRDVFRWAVWHGLRPAVLGLGAGILAALALSRVLHGVLYEISPTDPATFLSVPVLLLAAAFAACAVPAFRAARTEPMRVLRDE